MTDQPTRYIGEHFDTVGGGTVRVEPEGRTLDTGIDDPDQPSHSPDGFQVGYTGSGPAQLAFALLYDVTDDLDRTYDLYRRFKNDVVADLDDDWALSEEFIEDWVEAEQREN